MQKIRVITSATAIFESRKFVVVCIKRVLLITAMNKRLPRIPTNTTTPYNGKSTRLMVCGSIMGSGIDSKFRLPCVEESCVFVYSNGY